MARVVLRKDTGWFTSARNFREEQPFVEAKQNLMRALEAIGEQPTLEALENRLLRIRTMSFSGPPYVMEDEVYINRRYGPEKCYLGRIET